MLKSISDYLNSGHQRSVTAKKNILAMIFIRGMSILINLLLVPMTIDYVNAKTYGIWLTLSSIIAWISFFDIGLNNGLRNKFAEAKAKNDMPLAQKYVSTTYGLLTLIFIPLLLIFIILNHWINWCKILNISTEMEIQLKIVSVIVVSYFCLKFILSTISIILLADQKPAGAALRSLIEQILTLIIIYALTKIGTGSLLKLSIALCSAPLIVILYFNIALFRGQYKNFKPKITMIDFGISNVLLGLGVKFFIIQIAGIIQYQTANFIIIRNYGSEEVTAYNIAYKYFGILMMVMGIIVAPLWSAVTDAFTLKDFKWIFAASKKYFKIASVLVLVGILMLISAQQMYELWIGKGKVEISFSLSFWMFIFAAINIIGSIYVGILNGIGDLKVQTIACIFSPVIFILFTFFFIKKLHWGVSSIVIASIIANFNAFILAPIQVIKLFKIEKSGNRLA